jgi:hypothetical protein
MAEITKLSQRTAFIACTPAKGFFTLKQASARFMPEFLELSRFVVTLHSLTHASLYAGASRAQRDRRKRSASIFQ